MRFATEGTSIKKSVRTSVKFVNIENISDRYAPYVSLMVLDSRWVSARYLVFSSSTYLDNGVDMAT